MVATAAAFTLATLRAGAVQIPAIGTGGAYWPLAAADALKYNLVTAVLAKTNF